MLTASRFSKLGRVTTAGLALLSLAIGAGVFVLNAKAHAQGGGALRINRFGPGVIGPNDTQGAETHILIGLLVPAVSNTVAPFRVQILNDDTELTLNAPAGTTRRSFFYDVFLSFDREKNLTMINFKNLRSGDIRTKVTKFNNVSIRVLPAVQDGNTPVPFISASANLLGTKPMRMGDGSVVPLPFESQLPAVQDEIAL